MKKFVAIAALMATMPSAFAADGKMDASVNAEYRLRYQYDGDGRKFNNDKNTPLSSVFQRVKIGGTFKSGEKLSAHVSLLHNALWGQYDDLTATNASTHDTGTAYTQGITNNQNMMLVNQAYATWILNESIALKVGRGNATLGDGSIISANDWMAQPYSFDGVLAHYEQEMFRASLAYVKAIDNVSEKLNPLSPNGGSASANAADPEVKFYSASLDWKALPEVIKMAHLNVVKVNKDQMKFSIDPNNTLIPSNDETRWNAVVAGDVVGLDYKLNYGFYSGESVSANTETEGSMIAAELGYSLPSLLKSRVYVGYHVDSGDDSTTANKKEGYDSFYYEQHGNSGLMDVVKWGNLTFVKLGWTASPMDQVDVGVHGWMFSRTNSGEKMQRGFNQAKAGDSNGELTAAGNQDIGKEIDLVASKKYDNGLTITSWVGYFMPGDYLKTQYGNDDAYTQVFVEGKMTF